MRLTTTTSSPCFPGLRATRSGLAFLAGLLLVVWSGTARGDDWASLGLDATRSRIASERSGGLFDAGSWQHQWTASEQPSYRALLTTPAVGDGFLAFATQRNVVRVVNELDGKLVWQAMAGGAVFSSPTIWRGLVFVYGVNQQLYAFRLADGQVAWQKDLGAMGYSSPLVVDGNLFITSGNPLPRLWCLDALTGTTRWASGDGVLSASALASVAVADGHILVGELEGSYHSFALTDGAWQWTTATGGRVALSSPLVVGSRVYLLPGGASARLHAVDLATGLALPGWPLELAMPGAGGSLGTPQQRMFVASSVAGGSDGLAFSVRVDDRLNSSTGGASTFLSQEVLFAVDGANRQVLWSTSNGRLVTQDPNDTPNFEFLPTPALYRGPSNQLLIAAASTLAATVRVFSLDGEERWGATTSGPTRSSPVMANGRLVVATDAGIIHSFLSGTNRPPIAPAGGFLPIAGADSAAAQTRLQWTAAVEPEAQPVRYLVRVDDDGEILRDWDLEATTPPGQTFLELPALTVGSTYTFALRARDSQGALSSWTAPQSFRASASPVVSVDGQPATSGLQAALAAALPGSTVSLGAGRYDLSSTLRIPAGVTLTGSGPHLTTLTGKGLAAVVAPGADSTLAQLTVAGGHIGVLVDGATGVHLANIVLRDNDQAGLEVTATGTGEVVSATIVRNGTGVRAWGATKVRNALVTDNDRGLQAVSADQLTSRYNDVYQNHVEDYRDVNHGEGDLALAVVFASTDPDDLRLRPAQPTTDHGDPMDDFSLEPEPNGLRINIGAFGNTALAELSATTEMQPEAPPDSGAALDIDGGVDGAPDDVDDMADVVDGGAAIVDGAAEVVDLPSAPGGSAASFGGSGGCSFAGASDVGVGIPALTLLGLGLTLRSRRRRRDVGVAARPSARGKRVRRLVLLMIGVAAGVLSPGRAQALTCTWNKTSGTTNWDASAANWSTCNRVPTSADAVVFGTPGVGNCTMNVSPTVASITIQSGYSGTIAQSATQTATVTGAFSQAGGTFGAVNQLVIGTNLALTGGTFNGGAVTINGGAGGTIQTSARTLSSLTLSGTGTWTLSDALTLTGNLTITSGTLNAASKVVTVATLRKTNGAGAVFTAGATGTLVLNSGNSQILTHDGSLTNLTVATSLVGYWNFDEGGVGTTTADQSTNNNTGTLTNGPVRQNTSLPFSAPSGSANSYALQFDGAAATGDVVTFNTIHYDPISVSLWARRTGAGGSSGSYLYSTQYFNIYLLQNDTVRVIYSKGGGTNQDAKYSAGTFPADSVWRHILVTISFSGNPVVYIDGVSQTVTLDAGTGIGTQIVAPSPSTGNFGNRAGVDRTWLGSIDDVRVYNTILDQSDASTLAAGRFPPMLTVQGTTISGTIALDNTTRQDVYRAYDDAGSSGAVVGYPVTSFNWSSSLFNATYVLYNNVNGGTTDKLYKRDTDGVAVAEWTLPGNANFVGAPKWTNPSGSTFYVFVIDSLGNVYKLLDNGASFTQSATYRDGTNATATSPLAADTTNIYWTGNQGAAVSTPMLFRLPQAAFVSPGSVGATVSEGAVPSLTGIGGASYIFYANGTKLYKVQVSTMGTPTASTFSTAAGAYGRVSIQGVLGGVAYWVDYAGTVWAANPSSLTSSLWSYHDNVNHSGCAVNSACSAKNVFVDGSTGTQNRLYYADRDGHVYAIDTNTHTVLNASYPFSPGGSDDVFEAAPLYRSGVIAVGSMAGMVYFIDQKSNVAGAPALISSYYLESAVSTIAWDFDGSQYVIGTASGRLYYISQVADPTSSYN